MNIFKQTMRFHQNTLPGLSKPRLELLLQPAETWEESLAWAKETIVEIKETRVYIRGNSK